MGDKTLLAVRLPVKAECQSNPHGQRGEFINDLLSLAVSR
jgi:hypothetical protein